MSHKLLQHIVFLFYFAALLCEFSLPKLCPYKEGPQVWIKQLPLSPNFPQPYLPELFESQSSLFRGSGSFGEVREVELAPGFPKIAVKRVLRKDIKVKELEIMQELNDDEATPQLYLCAKDSDYFYIGQQLMHHSLDQETVMTAIRLKSREEAFNLLKTLFDALLKMHSKGLIHNDVKPENLMTDENIQRVLLVDLGAAEKVEDGNNFLGSPYYMTIARQTNSKANFISDYYAAALSIGVIYSSLDDIFKRADIVELEYTEIPALCYSASQKNWGNFGEEKNLRSFCVKNLKRNLVRALEGKFGRYRPKAKLNEMNFTTLLAEVVDFENSKFEEGKVQAVLKFLSRIYKIDQSKLKEKPNVFLAPPKEAEKDPRFEHSQQMHQKRKAIEDEIVDLLKEMKKSGSDKQKLIQAKAEFEGMYKKLLQEELTYIQKSKAWQDHPEFLKLKLAKPEGALAPQETAKKGTKNEPSKTPSPKEAEAKAEAEILTSIIKEQVKNTIFDIVKKFEKSENEKQPTEKQDITENNGMINKETKRSSDEKNTSKFKVVLDPKRLSPAFELGKDKADAPNQLRKESIVQAKKSPEQKEVAASVKDQEIKNRINEIYLKVKAQREQSNESDKAKIVAGQQQKIDAKGPDTFLIRDAKERKIREVSLNKISTAVNEHILNVKKPSEKKSQSPLDEKPKPAADLKAKYDRPQSDRKPSQIIFPNSRLSNSKEKNSSQKEIAENYMGLKNKQITSFLNQEPEQVKALGVGTKINQLPSSGINQRKHLRIPSFGGYPVNEESIPLPLKKRKDSFIPNPSNELVNKRPSSFLFPVNDYKNHFGQFNAASKPIKAYLVI